MRGRSLVITVCALGISGIAVLQTEAIEAGDVRSPAEQAAVGPVSGRYPLDRYVIGNGSGDLTKGHLCAGLLPNSQLIRMSPSRFV